MDLSREDCSVTKYNLRLTSENLTRLSPTLLDSHTLGEQETTCEDVKLEPNSRHFESENVDPLQINSKDSENWNTENLEPPEIKCEPEDLTSSENISAENLEPPAIKCEPEDWTSSENISAENLEPPEIKCEPDLRDVDCSEDQVQDQVTSELILKDEIMYFSDNEINMQENWNITSKDTSVTKYNLKCLRVNLTRLSPTLLDSYTKKQKINVQKIKLEPKSEDFGRENLELPREPDWSSELQEKVAGIKFEQRQNEISCSVEKEQPQVKINLKCAKSKKSPCACQICDRKYKCQVSLLKHVQLHKSKKINNKGLFPCQDCDKQFISEHLLNTHKVSHTNIRPHKCPKCTKYFKNIIQLKQHDNNVHKPKPSSDIRPFQCDLCPRRFKEKSKLKKHGAVHSNAKPFQCKLCDSKYKFRKGLNRHLLLHNEVVIKCKKCMSIFSSEETLAEHRINCESTSFNCKICGRILNSMSQLNQHYNNHFKLRPYLCKKCGRNFKSTSWLHQHLAFHNEHRPYSCEKCGKKFKSEAHVKIHMNIHILSRKFKCEECNKRFKLKSHLYHHIKTHSDVKPFLCALCNKRFRTKKYISLHIHGVHTTARPFECGICDKVFALKCQLRQHVEQKHLNW